MINEIGEIEFRDLKVKVYEDKYSVDFICSWRARNPDSFYKGIVNYNPYLGKITYPEGVIIPVQTQEDREMIPLFVLVNELNSEVISQIKDYLESEYKRRNNG